MLTWFLRYVNHQKRGTGKNFNLKFSCNKIALPYTQAKLPCVLWAIVGSIGYDTRHIFRTCLQTIVYFFQNWKRECGARNMTTTVNWLGCGGILLGVGLNPLPWGYRCTAGAGDRVYQSKGYYTELSITQICDCGILHINTKDLIIAPCKYF